MSQDDLFPYCLSLFRASRYVEGGEAMEEQAFALLEQIQEQVAASPHPLQVARWGCLLQALLRQGLVEGDDDELLEEADACLCLWRKQKQDDYPEVSDMRLWAGNYFLLRYLDPASRVRSASLEMLQRLLGDVEAWLCPPSGSTFGIEPCFLFPSHVWRDVEGWALLLCRQVPPCLPQAARVLAGLHALRSSDSYLFSKTPPDPFREQIKQAL